MHPEHLRCDPLPQDDLAGGNRRCHRNLYHRLHVLCHGECITRFRPVGLRHAAFVGASERAPLNKRVTLNPGEKHITADMSAARATSCAAVKRRQMFLPLLALSRTVEIKESERLQRLG